MGKVVNKIWNLTLVIWFMKDQRGFSMKTNTCLSHERNVSTFYEEETFIPSSCFSKFGLRDDLRLGQINLDTCRFLFGSWTFPR